MTFGRAGSSPVLGTNIFDLVAQLVEHLPFKERVLGSSPSQVTFFFFAHVAELVDALA